VARKEPQAVLLEAAPGCPQLGGMHDTQGLDGGAEAEVLRLAAVLVELALGRDAGDEGAWTGAVGEGGGLANSGGA
jgi:hypothetical protein